MKEKNPLKIQPLLKVLLMQAIKGQSNMHTNTVKEKFITGQNEREETTQDTIVTKRAAFASYEINYLTYITATYTLAVQTSGTNIRFEYINE